MAQRQAKVLNVEGFTKTLTEGLVDCTITIILRPGDVPKRRPFTYNSKDRGDDTLAVRDWLDKHKIDPFAEAADVDFTEEIIAGIKREAGRRIRQIMPRIAVERELTGGKPIAQETKDAVAAIRARSNELEQGNPLPLDYTADKHWN